MRLSGSTAWCLGRFFGCVLLAVGGERPFFWVFLCLFFVFRVLKCIFFEEGVCAGDFSLKIIEIGPVGAEKSTF